VQRYLHQAYVYPLLEPMFYFNIR